MININTEAECPYCRHKKRNIRISEQSISFFCAECGRLYDPCVSALGELLELEKLIKEHHMGMADHPSAIMCLGYLAGKINLRIAELTKDI